MSRSRVGTLPLRAAVAALVVIVLGGACTAPDEDEVPPRPAQLPALPHLEPVRTIWPEAVSEVPAERADGTLLWPVGALSGDEMLLMADKRRPEFVTYDSRTRKQRVIARAPEWASCGGCFEIQKVALGASQVAFIVKGYAPDATTGGRRHYELWAMPRAGGRMRKVARLPPGITAEHAYLRGFQIVGEQAAWWGYDGDIWRVPMSGGVPQPVLPGRRLRMSSWPWAFDSGERTVVNVETGQELDTTGTDAFDGGLTCGPAWCVGARSPDLWEVRQATILRLDGSGRTTVPGDARPARPPIRDRLALLGVPTIVGDHSVARVGGSDGLGNVVQLYDLCTRQSALLGSYALAKAQSPWQEIMIGAWTQDGPLVFWRVRDRLVVADLARIGRTSCPSPQPSR